MVISGCPRCGQDLSNKKQGLLVLATCRCGWIDDRQFRQAKAEQEKKITLWMSLSTALGILVGLMVFNWGIYTVPVLYIKAKQVSLISGSEDYQRLARYCTELRKWNCVETAYLGLMQDPKNLKAVAYLALLKAQLGEHDEARSLYAGYFRRGGDDADAMLNYAHLLENKSEIRNALDFYRKSIDARPDTLPVQATSGIVRLLVKNGRHKEALETIRDFHASAGNAKGYLNKELDQLQATLKKTGQRGKPRMPAQT